RRFGGWGEELTGGATGVPGGAGVTFPEGPAPAREDMREIAPNVMIGPPRFWETMCSEYQVKIADAGRIKAAAARVALDIGMRVAERRIRRQPVGVGLRLLAGLAQLLTFRALRDRLALSRGRPR